MKIPRRCNQTTALSRSSHVDQPGRGFLSTLRSIDGSLLSATIKASVRALPASDTEQPARHIVCGVTKKPTPKHVTLSPASNAVDHRKVGWHRATWTFRLTVVQALVAVLSLVVAAVGVYGVYYYATRPTKAPAEPGALVVIRPDIGIGGAQIFAVPEVSQPVDYLAGGSQLRVGCFKEVKGKYVFVLIVGDFEANRWVDLHDLALPEGGSVVATIAKLGACED